MVFKRTFWTKVLIFVLLVSSPAEMGTKEKISKDWFEPPAMSAEDRARIREYGQIKRYSPGVYEMDSEPLTDEWSAYNQHAHTDEWDDFNWSLEDVMEDNYDADIDDMSGGLEGMQNYEDDFDFFSEYQIEIARLEREMQKNKPLADNVGKRFVNTRKEIETEPDHDHLDANTVIPLKTSTKMNDKRRGAFNEKMPMVKEIENYTDEGFGKGNDRRMNADGTDETDVNDAESDILAYIKALMYYLVENIDTMAREFITNANEVTLYTMDMLAQIYTDFIADGAGFAWADSVEVPDITAFFKGMLEYGTEFMATFVAALDECMEYDINWIPGYLFESIMVVKDFVVNKANPFLVYIRDLLVDLSSATGSERVSSSVLDYGIGFFGNVVQAVKGLIDSVSGLEWFDQGLVLLHESLDVVAFFFQSFYDLINSDHISLDMAFVKGILYSFSEDALAAWLRLMAFLSNSLESVYNSELVSILKEEITEPIYSLLFDVYNQYIYPVQYLVQKHCQFLSSFGNGVSSGLSKYLLKVKRANDKMVDVLSGLILTVSDFVQMCGTKECLLSTANSFLQDPKFYYRLFWFIVYLILALSLIYFSYISNKVTILFILSLVKIIVKWIVSLLSLLFQTGKEIRKAKPKMVEHGSSVAFDEFTVRIKESDYTELMEASERKVRQMRKILELESELEEMKLKNMVSFCEMYQKQAELKTQNTPSVTEEDIVDSDDLFVL